MSFGQDTQNINEKCFSCNTKKYLFGNDLHMNKSMHKYHIYCTFKPENWFLSDHSINSKKFHDVRGCGTLEGCLRCGLHSQITRLYLLYLQKDYYKFNHFAIKKRKFIYENIKSVEDTIKSYSKKENEHRLNKFDFKITIYNNTFLGYYTNYFTFNSSRDTIDEWIEKYKSDDPKFEIIVALINAIETCK